MAERLVTASAFLGQTPIERDEGGRAVTSNKVQRICQVHAGKACDIRRGMGAKDALPQPIGVL